MPVNVREIIQSHNKQKKLDDIVAIDEDDEEFEDETNEEREQELSWEDRPDNRNISGKRPPPDREDSVVLIDDGGNEESLNPRSMYKDRGESSIANYEESSVNDESAGVIKEHKEPDVAGSAQFLVL
jgi:hypothetical protein